MIIGMIKGHPTQNRMARQADPQTSAAALDGDQRYCRTAGRRILRRADSHLPLLADRAGADLEPAGDGVARSSRLRRGAEDRASGR
jgi:hypothetical protein